MTSDESVMGLLPRARVLTIEVIVSADSCFAPKLKMFFKHCSCFKLV